MTDEKRPMTMSLAEIKSGGQRVAAEMKTAGTISPELRRQFIDIRAALFQRGIYDPLLVRFDSATAPRATDAEVAERLAEVAAAL